MTADKQKDAGGNNWGIFDKPKLFQIACKPIPLTVHNQDQLSRQLWMCAMRCLPASAHAHPHIAHATPAKATLLVAVLLQPLGGSLMIHSPHLDLPF